MSCEVKIKNKQLFKRPLVIADITMGKYAYGHMDEYWRREDGLIEGYNVLYNPDKIGRGIEFKWSNNLKDEIELRMNYLSTRYDIEMFYEVIRNIMHLWKTKTFEREGEICSEADIDRWCQSDKEVNLDWLADKNDTVTIFGAEIPLEIDFGIEKIKNICANRDDEGYADYLHELQSIDAYYAVPIIYKFNETEFFGSYSVTATADIIFPRKATDPALFKNPDTGEQIKCSFFVVTLVSIEDKAVIGRMAFDEFVEKAKVLDCPDFDATHVFMKGLSESVIHDLANSDHRDPLKRDG